MNRSLRRQIPSFSLYGEHAAAIRQPDALHIEDIPSRSRKYLWRIDSHRHTGLSQCVYVTAGPVVAELEGSRTERQGPTIIVIPQGAIHGFGFRTDTQGYVLTLNVDRVLAGIGAPQQAGIGALFSAPRIIDLAADTQLAARLKGMFQVTLQEFKQPDGLAVVIDWLACSALSVLASRDLDTGSIASAERHAGERLRRFRLLIESYYAKRWPVRRYARQLALSESGLNRLCMTSTGHTAFDLIQQRLALEARRRLVYVAAPVAAIAAELGFKDPAYFCRFFRKHTGLSPSAFRRRQTDG
jgi:AraC family transcriptional regulator, transcriptional activator of pobA